MDNIVKIRIFGNEFKVISPDGEEHAKKIAAAVDAKIRDIISDDPGASTSKVALIASMDFCESEMKYHHIALKLKRRLIRSEEEVSRLARGNNEEEYLEEITALEENLAAREKELKKKTDEILLLKEDLAAAEGYRLSLSEKEKEINSLMKINAELDAALKKAENRIAEFENMSAEIDDDFDNYDIADFEDGEPDYDTEDGKNRVLLNENAKSYEEAEESYADDDIIIPGYLDDENQTSDYNEENENQNLIENPFGLDYGNNS